MDQARNPFHMADYALTTCTVVEKVDRPACDSLGRVLMRYVNPGFPYVGSRERRKDALARAVMTVGVPVTRQTHIFLRTRFSTAGVAYYGMKYQGGDHAFAPMLARKVYNDTSYDWKVWRFHGDLPLQATSDGGQPLIVSEWEEIV